MTTIYAAEIFTYEIGMSGNNRPSVSQILISGLPLVRSINAVARLNPMGPSVPLDLFKTYFRGTPC